MNTKKQTLPNKVLQPCSKHSKIKTVCKSRVSTHIPTVRCHEEVMSKLCPHYNTDDVEHVNHMHYSCDQKKGLKKSRPRKDENTKHFKTTVIGDSASSPGVGEVNDPCYKTMKSKSLPLNQKPNLEDSVDFIPVKLSSTNDSKHRLKTKPEAKKQNTKFSKYYRPTWDTLLKTGSQSLPQNDRRTERISTLHKVYENNLKAEEYLPHTPKKKVSINDSNTEQDDLDKQNVYKDAYYPKTNEQSFDPFYVSCPVKTLDFLIKKLREKLINQPENDNLHKIILDMENALLKISVENEVYSKTLKEENGHKVESSSNTVSKSSLCNNNDGKGSNGQLDIVQLQRGLEESCRFLQSLCIKQKENCSNHIREKEQLTLQLAESRRLLAIAKSREKDYEVTIGELRLKILEANTNQDKLYQSVQELSDNVTKLKAENEKLQSYKEALNKCGVRLKETAREKEILNSKLYLKDLEIEKLKVLLEVKENLSPVPKDGKNLENNFDHELKLSIPTEEKDNSTLSLSTVTSWIQSKAGIICSSQASGSPGHSPSPYNSWQHISSIYQRPSAASELNKGIAEIFQDLKKRTDSEPPRLDLEIPSSANSFWSDKEEDNDSKIAFSDHESGTMSS